MLRIASLYALFAALSIAVNIGTQVAAMALYAGPGAVPLSILAGTATGLVAKYVLDKRWIFAHVSRDRLHEARTFALYTGMGVVTTLVFWGTELAFHLLFASDAMRYLGGVAGLVVGYALKYRLDRRWVFTGGA
ncbi:GtrA family protein [Pseudoxanthomonas sp. 10H]|uniref:GtrA family protein n=1 Tax=Pseudoxanthomonas sp. 10H TaxID=3242729 RepID=UPI0035565625